MRGEGDVSSGSHGLTAEESPWKCCVARGGDVGRWGSRIILILLIVLDEGREDLVGIDHRSTEKVVIHFRAICGRQLVSSSASIPK